MSRPRGVFVAGTDTGVGKTLIAAALTLALKEEGVDVGVMKPLESGGLRFEGTLIPRDAYHLKEVSGVDDPLELINPYCFEPPLAPAEAAAREGVEVDLGRVFKAYEELTSRHEVMVVEGVGGLLVPICEGTLLPELIKALGLPVLLVGRTALGTINHTLLSLSCCQREGIEVIGFLLNKVSPDSDPSEESNPSWISRFSRVPYLGTFPYLGELGAITEAKAFLQPLFTEHIDLGRIFDLLGLSRGRTS